VPIATIRSAAALAAIVPHINLDRSADAVRDGCSSQFFGPLLVCGTFRMARLLSMATLETSCVWPGTSERTAHTEVPQHRARSFPSSKMKQGPTARLSPVPFRPGYPSCWLCHAGLCLASRRSIAHECFSRISSFVSSGVQWQTLQQMGPISFKCCSKASELAADRGQSFEQRPRIAFWNKSGATGTWRLRQNTSTSGAAIGRHFRAGEWPPTRNHHPTSARCSLEIRIPPHRLRIRLLGSCKRQEILCKPRGSESSARRSTTSP